MHSAGLILARGGSKAIPKKNIACVGGKPLLLWALNEMQKLSKIRLDSIWVSTDDEEIAAVALEAGVQVHHRSHASAADETPSIVAVQEWLTYHPDVDVIALVQCTSPLLKSKYLDAAFQLIGRGYDSVFSVTRHHLLRWKEVRQDESTVALNFDPLHRPQRQEWSGELVENGMFYITKAQLVKEGLLQGGMSTLTLNYEGGRNTFNCMGGTSEQLQRCAYVEIPKELSLDVDSPLDLEIAELQLRRRHDTL